MEQSDKEFIIKIAKDQSDTRRRLDDVEKRLERIEKIAPQPAQNWQGAYHNAEQRIVQNITSETTTGKYGIDLSFEGGMQMDPTYRARLSMQFLVELEQLIKRFRVNSLYGQFQKIQAGQTPQIV